MGANVGPEIRSFKQFLLCILQNCCLNIKVNYIHAECRLLLCDDATGAECNDRVVAGSPAIVSVFESSRP